MAETETKVSKEDTPNDAGRYCEAFRHMLLARTFEDRIASLYKAGKIVGGVFLGRGQEAFSVALAMALDKDRGDVYGPLIRDQAGRLAFGEPLLDAARTYLGSVKGPMRGRDGNVHRGSIRDGVTPMISHLGANISVINGRLMARRYHHQLEAVGGACIGDGGTSTGSFHEALNQAAVEKLPLVVAVADNQYAYSTPTSRQFACADLVDRASGYGVEGYSIDGTDLTQCLDTFAQAVARAREGHGPQMVVGHMLRLCGHGEHDDASYIPEEQKKQRYGGDCIALARQHMSENGVADQKQIEKWAAEAVQQVEKDLTTAQQEPKPDPYQENWRAIVTNRLVEGKTEG